MLATWCAAPDGSGVGAAGLFPCAQVAHVKSLDMEISARWHAFGGRDLLFGSTIFVLQGKASELAYLVVAALFY